MLPSLAYMALPAQEDMNKADEYGRTPLMLASGKGNEGLVNLMLSHGARVNDVDNSGYTALMYASMHNRKGVMDQLLFRLPYPHMLDVADSYGKTALIHAAEYAANDAVKLLIQHGADVDMKDAEGNTAAFYAYRMNYTQINMMLADARNIREQFNKLHYRW